MININDLANFIDLHKQMIKVAYIRKLPNGKYRVFSEKGKNLGTYDSMVGAKKRLRQVEFFKHKKASLDTIDFSKLDTISYSAIMRELNKLGDIDVLKDFLHTYKICFDALVLNGNQNPAECALPKTLLLFGKKYTLQLPEHKHDTALNKSK